MNVPIDFLTGWFIGKKYVLQINFCKNHSKFHQSTMEESVFETLCFYGVFCLCKTPTNYYVSIIIHNAHTYKLQVMHIYSKD